MNRFDLRPRTVGEVLDGAFRMWVANLRTLVALVACVVVPLQIIVAVVFALTVPHGDQLSRSISDLHIHFVREPDGRLRDVGPHTSPEVLWVQAGVAALSSVLSTAACVRALADVAAGAQPSIAASLGAAVRRLPALVVLFLARAIGVVVGLILIIVPGLWLAGSWSVSVPALVLEGAGSGHALRRSAGLVRGRWWPVAGTVAVTDIVVLLLSGVIQNLLRLADSGRPGVGVGVLVFTLGVVIAALVTQPLNAAVRVGLYLDLRVRAGGAELAGLADQLGLQPPEPPESTGPVRPPADGARGSTQPPFWPPPPGWAPPEDPEPEDPAALDPGPDPQR